MAQNIDVTGLPPEAVEAVRSLVTLLRERTTNGVEGQSNIRLAGSWADRLQAWVNSHPKREIVIDDSREGIYAGRGE